MEALVLELASVRALVDVLADDLRATAEELHEIRTASKSFCHVCWTSSYAPCEETFPGAVPDGKNGFMYCQVCHLTELLRAGGRDTVSSDPRP